MKNRGSEMLFDKNKHFFYITIASNFYKNFR